MIYFFKNFKYDSSVNIYIETKSLFISVYKSVDKIIYITHEIS